MTTTLARIKEISANQGDKVLTEFTGLLFKKANAEFLSSFDAETLLAISNSGLDFLKSYYKDSMPKSKVRVFNPQFEADSWSADCTIVEVVLKDRPFVVDSLKSLINQKAYKLHHYLHPIMSVKYADNNILSFSRKEKADDRAITYELLFIDRIDDEEEIKQLASEISDVLDDVILATDDYEKMRQVVKQKISYIEGLAKTVEPEKQKLYLEYSELLKWMDDGNFIFLGYREYEILNSPEPSLKLSVDTGLGLLRKKPSDFNQAVALKAISKELRERVSGEDLLIVSKTAESSRVHRPVKMDYIGLKRFKDSKNIGECRFIGLFTSKALSSLVETIPVLRLKLENVLQDFGVEKDSHDYKEIVEIVNSMPKSDLFWASEKQIEKNVRLIIDLKESGKTSLVVQADPLSRGFSVMVIMPRENFNAKIRKRIQEKFYKEFDASHVDYNLSIGGSDSSLRLNFFFTTNKSRSELDLPKLEAEIAEISRSWDDHMLERLIKEYGEIKGRKLARKYLDKFSAVYKADVSYNLALKDIVGIESLAESDYQVTIINTNDRRSKNTSQLKIYHKNKALVLSEIMPILENLGLYVLEQTSYFLELEGIRGIDVFRVRDNLGQPLNVREDGDRLKQALVSLLDKKVENDRLNGLVIYANYNIRQIALLRTYVMYYSQLNPSVSRAFVVESLLKHSIFAKNLLLAFAAKFNPDYDKDRFAALEEIRNDYYNELDKVSSLAEDSVLRGMFNLVESSVRSNYYLQKDLISIKFESAKVTSMPEPRPMFEIAVMGLNVEGAHLRGGKVARGGIRWSDRFDDFRTEILGLMKTQMTKNAVIVPVGSKGGFVLKNAPSNRAELFEYAKLQYQDYIRALLDVTDNIENDKLVHPRELIIYDSDDPYLVVAADKGTASFSDLANQVSAEYNYWLGDAFASGGSYGYDHKAEGITARGAWEGVSRHFREIGINVHKDEISVAGIGDMAGDVFGNGMLYTKTIKLLAAFNHMHIFLDPNPSAKKSFMERKRLFEMPRSSWQDYDSKLISKGGGVFERSSKSIKLSNEVKTMLSTTKDSMSGEELIRSILTMPVDLLWNGGIGTYIKSSQENDSDVGDSGNDRVRVDADKLRAKIVGEGGNLGFTQLARIEYAKNGGRINTDAIDNSAGVDMSDHEVNIKIAFEPLMTNGEMSFKQRNAFLEKMTNQVSELVLEDNYKQTQIISIAQKRSKKDLMTFEGLIDYLVDNAGLDRAVEYLPTAKEMQTRKATKQGLERPELAILLAYSKMDMYQNMLEHDLSHDDFQPYLVNYFPAKMRKKYKKIISNHQLRPQIIATQLTNEIIDILGIDFVYRLLSDLGIEHLALVKAVIRAFALLDVKDILADIKAHDNKTSIDLQYHMLEWVKDAVEALVSYSLQSGKSLNLAVNKVKMDELKPILREMLPASEQAVFDKAKDSLIKEGISEELSSKIVTLEYLPTSMAIIELSNELDKDLRHIAEDFYKVGNELHLADLRDDIARVNSESKWDKIALSSLEMDMRQLQKQISFKYLSQNKYSDVKSYIKSQVGDLKRYKKSLKKIGRKKLQISSIIVLKNQLERLAEKL